MPIRSQTPVSAPVGNHMPFQEAQLQSFKDKIGELTHLLNGAVKVAENQRLKFNRQFERLRKETDDKLANMENRRKHEHDALEAEVRQLKQQIQSRPHDEAPLDEDTEASTLSPRDHADKRKYATMDEYLKEVEAGDDIMSTSSDPSSSIGPQSVRPEASVPEHKRRKIDHVPGPNTSGADGQATPELLSLLASSRRNLSLDPSSPGTTEVPEERVYLSGSIFAPDVPPKDWRPQLLTDKCGEAVTLRVDMVGSRRTRNESLRHDPRYKGQSRLDPLQAIRK
ncbi:hypothetical protein NM208_g7050 [Fusarium decemcellulare]|uniref:Uncharacterized protein n=1 Tax=Fusarium decemcellulare TaxID=57161 RepID=A0ACC1SAK6_9HYPO|nr:hypothetical protein NM208_g7050 [Fusarium decemcellulare]